MMRKLLLAMFFMALASNAPAQDYPNRAIRIVVPLSPAGGTDGLARVVAAKLRDRLGQSVVVENRAGAAGNIGAEFVFNSPPDGYTLLFTQPAPLVVNKDLYGKLPFEPEKFVPIALVSLQDLLLAVHPGVPARTLQELIAYAKANPGKLNYGSSGAGSAPHLAAELFKSMAGLDMVHVPYKGSGESQLAVLSGEVDFVFFAFSSALANARAGKLRPLAVGGTKRNPQLPDVPSVSEVVKGFQGSSWTALVAPPGTPSEIVNRLSSVILAITKEPDVRKRLLDAGDEASDATPAEMARFLDEERKRWGGVIRAAGITAN
jgi:tripartite-type tricarboxylate transporter receptor subunit TctC